MVDEQLLSTTWKDLPERYDWNQSNTMPCKAKCRSIGSNNSSWSTVSKSVVRSSRHTADIYPMSVARSKSLNTFVTAVSGLWYHLYIDCIFGINLLLSKKAGTRTWTTFSSSCWKYIFKVHFNFISLNNNTARGICYNIILLSVDVI